jgi:hypothetical protein
MFSKWLRWAQAPNAFSKPLRAYIRYRTMLLSTQLVSTKRPLEDRSLPRQDLNFLDISQMVTDWSMDLEYWGRDLGEWYANISKNPKWDTDARKQASPSLSRKHLIDRHICLLTAAGWPVDRKLSAAYTGLRTTVMFPILSVGNWAYMHGHFQHELYSNLCVQLPFHWMNYAMDLHTYI